MKMQHAGLISMSESSVQLYFNVPFDPANRALILITERNGKGVGLKLD